MRVYNFSAGPSMLPEQVLNIAASEMMDYHGSGQSVMEMSHRSAVYEEIITTCETLLRKAMNIPPEYKVLFLQGGAWSQFAMVPMNLMKKGKADFVVTGMWAEKACKEAKKFGQAVSVASSADKNFSYIPKVTPDMLSPDADYLHICWNNTIFGTKWNTIPQADVPVVVDMSSSILSEPIDVSKFGLIYAGAQKNMGCAGLTVVIVREDILGEVAANCPSMFDYRNHIENGSMFNTPPTYSIYICKLVLDWLLGLGGVDAVYAQNLKKAKILYSFLESSSLFTDVVNKDDRSLMNVTFLLRGEGMDKQFDKEATAAGFINLKGHRLVGGMRASIYNAMPVEGVEKLVDFMKDFERRNG